MIRCALSGHGLFPLPCPPEALGRLSESPDEGAAHPFGIAEASRRCDLLDGLPRALDAFACRFQPKALNRLGGADADGADESAGEIAGAHGHMIGHAFDGQPFR